VVVYSFGPHRRREVKKDAPDDGFGDDSSTGFWKGRLSEFASAREAFGYHLAKIPPTIRVVESSYTKPSSGARSRTVVPAISFAAPLFSNT